MSCCAEGQPVTSTTVQISTGILRLPGECAKTVNGCRQEKQQLRPTTFSQAKRFFDVSTPQSFGLSVEVQADRQWDCAPHSQLLPLFEIL